ncbi:MAG: hypothetical protein F6K19_06965 [Cyanothece sp. SIO1E1]|nr:hypothetical protein [Cyanothece sp. SIO1E1]
MKKVTLLAIAVCITTLSSAQDIKDDVYERVPASEFGENYEVFIKNINGELEVEGHDGNDIIIEGQRELWKDRGRISDDDAADYQLKTLIRGGQVFVYVDAPGVEIDFKDGRFNYNMRWSRDQIRFNFDLKVKIPRNMDVNAGTINGGNLLVEGMDAAIDANNVNGSVTVMDAKSSLEANTVNGDIEVWFAVSPTTDMEFHTVNGTIEIFSPADFGAVVTFESLHGELYTDFDNVKRLPHQLNRAESRRGNRYKISSNSPIQIGEGGPSMNLELVNGSAYIRERKS